MNKIKINENEELIKIPVQAGDAVFIKYDRDHKPVIQVFSGVIPC